MDISLKGFDELKRKLEKLNELQGSIPLTEVLSQDFLSINTPFKSLEDLFAKGGYSVNSDADYEAIPQQDLDNFVAKNTSYKNWQELINAGMSSYITKKAGF